MTKADADKSERQQKRLKEWKKKQDEAKEKERAYKAKKPPFISGIFPNRIIMFPIIDTLYNMCVGVGHEKLPPNIITCIYLQTTLHRKEKLAGIW